MTKFFNILKRKLTLGNLFTIIASFIFAIIIRQLFLHYFEFLPLKGGLKALDISFFGIVVLFRIIFSAFLEYLLNDKFSIPLFEVIGERVGQKEVGITKLSMVDSNKQGSSSAENSTKGTSDVTKQKIEKIHKFIDEKFELGDKMWDVLSEQTNKIHKLHSIKSINKVEFFEENGGLDITVPKSMTDSESQKLSKEIGALDRSLQNKLSEYRNLITKDIKLYESTWTSTYKEMWDTNQKQYKELFDTNTNTNTNTK